MSTAFPSLSHTPRAFPLPTIAEDTLQYALHLPEADSAGEDSSTASASASALALLITQYVESLLIQPWLWNKDGWELKLASTSSGAASGSGIGKDVVRGGRTLKLEGRMRVGDAVDDEWLVVWLLREVSRRWRDLVIR